MVAAQRTTAVVGPGVLSDAAQLYRTIGAPAALALLRMQRPLSTRLDGTSAEDEDEDEDETIMLLPAPHSSSYLSSSSSVLVVGRGPRALSRGVPAFGDL